MESINFISYLLESVLSGLSGIFRIYYNDIPLILLLILVVCCYGIIKAVYDYWISF